MRTPSKSCHVDEVFDHDSLTAFAGANLLVDVMDSLDFPGLLERELPFSKAPWATYTSFDLIRTLVLLHGLGLPRIRHAKELEHDPLLALKLGLDKLPQISTLYRALDRFRSKEDTSCLLQVNKELLGSLVNEFVIPDLDSTVNTVHGSQEGACVSYNPRYRGRKSYQPLAAFDGNSQATVAVELRSGHS